MKNSSRDKMPPVMILCGGLGSRLRDVTELLPKPMVPVGQYPIVWHIMKTYAAFGVRRFILCLGYKREAFIDYFLHYRARTSDLTIRLGQNSDITYHDSQQETDWEVTLADTGELTMTGGRVARAAKYLAEADEDFFLTYGDALCDVDLAALLEHHRRSGRLLTVTAVHPVGRFGEMEFDNGELSGFNEKPQTGAGFINGGFMVLKKDYIARYLSPAPGLVFEQKMRDVLLDGEMSAFRHEGFWQCMDTGREHLVLNELWASGKAAWTRHW